MPITRFEDWPIGTDVEYNGRLCRVEAHDEDLRLIKLDWKNRPDGWGWIELTILDRYGRKL